jgi:hypothetical protein
MTMGSHQRTIGKSQARFTPRWILSPLGAFDTDVCAGDPRPRTIGRNYNITEADDCLILDWSHFGRCWCNPPFDTRIVGDFVARMIGHDRGTMLLHARTETAWYQPIFDAATAILWLAGRVVFENADGTPCRIENPKAKHYGKVANSGAPVVLIAFGFDDGDILEAAHERPRYDAAGNLVRPPGRLPGAFDPRRFKRFVLLAALDSSEQAKSWREIVVEWLRAHDGPVAVGDLYRAFAHHPKARANPHWQAKLRQTLQRGAGRAIARNQWVAA